MVDMAESYIKMIGSNRGRRGIRGLWDMTQADIAAVTGNPWGAQDYYVDGNRSTTSGDGKSWDTAFQTLAEAIAASNITIAASANRWWARRNRIFVCGDGEIDEDITVWPEKTDVIGVGYDLFPFPRIMGNHACAAATVGLRLINLGFYTQTTADLMSFPAGCHGLQILGCFMHPGTTSTKAIEITTSAHVRIIGNDITVGAGDMAKIFGVGVSIEGTVIHDTVIADNRITATAGIAVVEAAAAAFGSRIEDNYIRATALAIDDNSDDFQIINNRWMTDIDTTTSTAGYDFQIQLAAGNIQMGVTGLCDSVPYMKIAE